MSIKYILKKVKNIKLLIIYSFIFTAICIILNNNLWNKKTLDKITKQFFREKNERLNINYNQKDFCSRNEAHSVCFLGKRFCHPGYFGDDCNYKNLSSNPWYTADCPNLNQDITYHENMPIEIMSKGKNCTNEKFNSGISNCAYLCFSHPVSGVAQIPKAFWKKVSKNEIETWNRAEGYDDRGSEHLDGFKNYFDLPNNLGNYIEVGSGPYTQTQFIINKNFENITLLDPGASEYILKTKNCPYKHGLLYGKKVRILPITAEELINDEVFGQYDTLMSINVIEHVYDAFKFLDNLYNALKPGGIIIYHDRYYKTPPDGDGILGPSNVYHPIRLKKVVFEHFLSKFKTIYIFTGLTKSQIIRQSNENSIYFIGSKL